MSTTHDPIETPAGRSVSVGLSNTNFSSESPPVKTNERLLNFRDRWLRRTAGVVFLVALVLFTRSLPLAHWFSSLEKWIDGLGVWGPLAMYAVYVVAAVLFIPGSLLTLAAGAVFGLTVGTIVVSLASTTAVALSYLISRYFARNRVQLALRNSPRLQAIDQAIGEQGWKLVVLLRLSPLVPFNLQNYLYGVTSVRFVVCVLASWVAMLPGTFLYVYLGTLGKTALEGRPTTSAEWALRIVGLLATVAVTVFLARMSRNAIQQRVDFSQQPTVLENEQSQGVTTDTSSDGASLPSGRAVRFSTWLMLLLATSTLIAAIYAIIEPAMIQQ